MSDKKKPAIQSLRGVNALLARRQLCAVAGFLDAHGINYHLEGGTLLGFVREGRFLPWDHDVDLSMMAADAERFGAVYPKLLKKGYKVAVKRFKTAFPPIPAGGYRNFKIMPLLISLGKEVFPALRKHYLTLDIFVKYNDGRFTYWQEKKRIMRLDRKFVDSLEVVEALGRRFTAPASYREYLTAIYGDWSVPVKEWDVNVDSKSIFAAVP